MKLTAGDAYRVTSSRYAASEPPSASLASSASLCATDTHYTAGAPAPFQIPNPKSQDPNANGLGLGLGIRGLGFGIWDFLRLQQLAGRRRRKTRGVVGRFVRNREAVQIPFGVDCRHAARTPGGIRPALHR